jgi:hypothetical protein
MHGRLRNRPGILARGRDATRSKPNGRRVAGAERHHGFAAREKL